MKNNTFVGMPNAFEFAYFGPIWADLGRFEPI